MDKIEKIEVKEANKTIKKGFALTLKDITVITGENNSGKTNFIKTLSVRNAHFFDSKGADITEKIDISYIPAEFIIGETEFKIGKTSYVVATLKDIIKGNPVFKLTEDASNNSSNFSKLSSIVNTRINQMVDDGKNSDSIKLSIEPELDLSKYLDSVLSVKGIDRNRKNIEVKFDDLGQGWQRLIIISFILADAEQNTDDERLRLVLLEEPEVYMHPKFKRIINKMLKDIAKIPNYQVLITTHDPYFAITNSDSTKSLVHSFKRDAKGMTINGAPGLISGIEDELLHIFLFNRLLKKCKEKKKTLGPKGSFNSHLVGLKKYKIPTREYYWKDVTYKAGEKGEKMALPIYIRHQIHHSDNKYTKSKKNDYNDKDLEESIKIMNKILA